VSAGCSLAGALPGKLESPVANKARILPDGRAIAPVSAPTAIRLVIAAGNLIHTLPYPVLDVHYGSLPRLWPAYDWSGEVSFVLCGSWIVGVHRARRDWS
jgi:hypothetical protein